MHHTVKSLASKRLAADRRVFHEMVSQMSPFVLQIWHAHHAEMSTIAVGQGEIEAAASALAAPLEKAHIAMKVLRKSIVHGMREPHKNQDVMLFLSTLLQQTRAVLEMRRRFQSSLLQEPFEKYLVLHLKILTDLLECHPFSFLHTMKPALELICSLCFSQESAGLLFQRFTIYSLNIIKQVLLCMEYRTPKDLDDVKDPRILEGSNMKREFFTDSTVIEICGRLVSDYLPLSREELELWDSDPEEYMIDDSVSICPRNVIRMMHDQVE